MKTIWTKATGFLLLFTIVCGIGYTGIVTGLAQIIMPEKANGSMIKVDGEVYGSKLIGQSFSQDNHMWGRPVNLDVSTYKDENGKALAYAAPSNLSPASEEYAELMAQRVNEIREAHPEKEETPIPVELVTGSGSGLDPQISPSAAEYQVERLAKANDISTDQVREIIKKCTTGRFLGVFGENNVNVLEVNLMLDGIVK